MQVDSTPLPVQAGAEKRRRSRGKPDGRRWVTRRARQLASLYVSQLGDVSPELMTRVVKASELTALSELTRADHMSGRSSVPLDDLVRLERLAAQAVKQLGLDRQREPIGPSSLKDYIADTYGPEAK